MNAFFGDLVVPEPSPLILAERYELSEVRQALLAAGAIAEELGQGKAWSRAELHGANHGAGHPGQDAAAQILWLAPVAGLGFGGADLFDPEVTESDRQRYLKWARMRGHERSEMLERKLREAEMRRAEMRLIEAVAAGSAGRVWLPLRSELGISASQPYLFSEAYRRRIAFALAHEAHIEARSMEARWACSRELIYSPADMLAEALPKPEDRLAFSILLDALSELDGSEAGCKARKDDGIIDYESKHRMLRELLDPAAEARSRTLGVDGRMAVRALLAEVDSEYEHHMHRSGQKPRWGEIGCFDSYMVPQDPDYPTGPPSASPSTAT